MATETNPAALDLNTPAGLDQAVLASMATFPGYADATYVGTKVFGYASSEKWSSDKSRRNYRRTMASLKRLAARGNVRRESSYGNRARFQLDTDEAKQARRDRNREMAEAKMTSARYALAAGALYSTKLDRDADEDDEDYSDRCAEIASLNDDKVGYDGSVRLEAAVFIELCRRAGVEPAAAEAIRLELCEIHCDA